MSAATHTENGLPIITLAIYKQEIDRFVKGVLKRILTQKTAESGDAVADRLESLAHTDSCLANFIAMHGLAIQDGAKALALSETERFFVAKKAVEAMLSLYSLLEQQEIAYRSERVEGTTCDD